MDLFYDFYSKYLVTLHRSKSNLPVLQWLQPAEIFTLFCFGVQTAIFAKAFSFAAKCDIME